MKVSVRVVPNARIEGVSEEAGVLVVRVHAAAREGQANERAIELVARHFGVTKRHVRLAHGRASRFKVFEVG
jgi:uncharacterized protein YggU (UPF0235/DUF167 family)